MTDCDSTISALSSIRSVTLPLLHVYRLTASSHENTSSSSSSRRSSFTRNLLRPWSFALTSDISTTANVSDSIQLDAREGSNTLLLNRTPTHESTGSCAPYGDVDREQGVNDIRFASGRSGWWKQQMLVDRSLRSMAALTSLFASIMTIICIVYMPKLVGRHNVTSTSVGSDTGTSCESLEGTNVVSWTSKSPRLFQLMWYCRSSSICWLT